MPLNAVVELPESDRAELVRWLRAPSMPAGLAQRGRIVLLAAGGVGTNEIVTRTGVSKPTVIAWKKRYAAEGIGGLDDRPKPGRPAQVDEVAVVLATLERAAGAAGDHALVGPVPGRPSWASRSLGWPGSGGSGGSSRTAAGDVQVLAPTRSWRPRSATSSGLYLDPPERAVVLSVDEKSQIQALDRTAPMLPLRPGLPERRTHDYVRHGTTTLFAALEIATGKVTDACYPRHRHQEFLQVPEEGRRAPIPRAELHVVLDNYATHKHPEVRRPGSAGEPADHPALHPDTGAPG